MKKTLLVAALCFSSLLDICAQAKYEPTEANLKSREEFRDTKPNCVVLPRKKMMLPLCI
ncbi:MAG: hypothetical protein IKU94_04375 [Bacteroidaceae bacterium]|nr:hypothetical protein [Bacteroidaceae bacterium]MBR4930679.1 hypothetical protein [Bacteroidaceae bacterium]